MVERITPESWVVVGVLGKPRGLGGILWFRSFSEGADALQEGVVVRLTLRDKSTETHTVEGVGNPSGKYMVTLEGVDDRDAAERLVGAELAIQRKHFAVLDDGEFYHCDVVGSDVVDEAGAPVGTVLRVEAYPSVDALVVKAAEGDAELEIPVVDTHVLSVDTAAHRIVVDRAVASAEPE